MIRTAKLSCIIEFNEDFDSTERFDYLMQDIKALVEDAFNQRPSIKKVTVALET